MRKLLVAAGLALSLTLSSCLGPNNAQRSVANWNATLTDQNWINEVLFIVPLGAVQGIAWVGDVLIFNTLGYWGTNPIDDPGEFPPTFSNG